nr:hypothetical protein [Tanacetum cinerariifolium]
MWQESGQGAQMKGYDQNGKMPLKRLDGTMRSKPNSLPLEKAFTGISIGGMGLLIFYVATGGAKAIRIGATKVSISYEETLSCHTIEVGSSEGVSVSAKVGFKPAKQVYRQVSKKNNVNSGGINGRTSSLASKKANSSGSSFWNVKSSSTSTTSIVEKIDKIKRLVIDGKVTLVDDEGKLLAKVDSSVDHDSKDEVASVDNEMTNFLASKKVGYGTNSLQEQWTESYENDDYDFDPYDDDMYEGHLSPTIDYTNNEEAHTSNGGQFLDSFSAKVLPLKSNLFKGCKEQGNVLVSPKEVESKSTHSRTKPIPPISVAPAGQHVALEILAAHNAWIKGSKEIAGLMLMTMELEIQQNLEPLHAHEMLQELKIMFSQQVEQELLQTTMGKIVNELHAMINLHEQTLPKNNAHALHAIRADKVQKGNKHKKSQSQMAARGQYHGKWKNKQAYAPKHKIPPPPKREDPAKDSICHECGETGHWKRNCPQYVDELLKKKKNAASRVGGSGIFVIELNTILNRSWIYDTGCGTHICNTTRGLRVSRKLKLGALIFAIPRDFIFEIDLSNSYTNESSIYAVSNKRDKVDLDSALLWHCRLGHISKKCIEKLQHDGFLDSSDLRAFEKCVTCMSGKMARKPYTHQVERAKDLLGLIHSDVCGLFKIMSRQGASYFVTFTDDFSHYGYVYLLKHKHEVFKTFKVFQKEVENQLGKTIKLLRSDREGEYVSQEFLDHLKDHRIIAHHTPPYIPQHNGMSERRNRTLLDIVRSMMSQTTLLKSFWGYALETALNMVLTKKVEKTPYEVWHGQTLKLPYLNVWGCEALIKRYTLSKPDKLEPRSIKCILIGYPKETMGYSFYYPPENKVLVARSAEFLKNSLINQEASGSLEDLKIIQEEDTHPSIDTSLNHEEDDLEIDEPQSDIVPIRRSTRTRHASDSMCLYIDAEEHELGDLGEPANNKAALFDLESEKWLNVINVEMQSIKDNEVWVLFKLPPNGKIIGSKWLLKQKTDMDGVVHTYKARLVAKGYTQTSGIDYEETFSPVSDIRAIRILIAIAAYYDYEICIPMQEKLKLSKSQGASTPVELKRMQHVPYASAVGSIMYAVRCTRPDVEFAQSVTSRFQQNLGDLHWTTVKNILKYLKNTKDTYLFTKTGYVFVLNGGAVDWKSAKQSIFATSSAKAEYIAAFDASKEAVWVKKFISGLGVVPTIKEPISMYCDHTGAIAIANESRITKSARHLCAKVHYLREVIEYGDIKLEKVHTYDNLADPFTIALAFSKHLEHTMNIGMLPASAAVLTRLAALTDAAALGELCLAALTGTCPDFVKIAAGTKFLLGCCTFKPTQDLSHTNRPTAPIIEDWVSDSKDESKTKASQFVPSFVQSSEQVKNLRHSVQPVETSIPAATPKPTSPKLTSPKSNSSGKRRNRKTCFVCKSVNHLIKDYDYHTKAKAQPTHRNYAHRGNHKQPVSAAMPKFMVTRPRLAHLIVTKSKLPIRRHITCSPSPKTSNLPPRVIAAQALVVRCCLGYARKMGMETKGNPQYALKDKGVIDSGCSRHIIGNMSYLSRFKELNGGYVAFGGNPNGGKISGKGKIKTCKLDFDDVYFVKELKFDLFSVSQMCDKKNSVLFTDTECLVLSPDFKLPDEHQVLLRVPKENNMYNVNLKNIVPSEDLTCLFLKNNDEDAAFDEKKHDDKTKKEAKGKSPVESSTGYRYLSAEFEDCSKNDSNEVNVASTIVLTVGRNPRGYIKLSKIQVGLKLYKKSFFSSRCRKNKMDERGIVIRNKARLFVQGHTQEEGIDYEEVFAPLSRVKAIRLFLAYASFMGFMMYQMDVKSAFLYGTIEEEVYVYQPLGFEDPNHPNKVYKVVTALYGLHQAPSAWYETLANYLLENGFHRFKIDQTLFIKKQKGDILLVKQKKEGIFISQDKYVVKILRKFGITKRKLASTLIDTKKPLLKDPDVKRIFRYLKGKPHLGLWYPKDSPFDLVAYSDSDYAGASPDRKSTSGGCQLLGCRLISWQCKKQTVVATSSTEAKYVAAASSVHKFYGFRINCWFMGIILCIL